MNDIDVYTIILLFLLLILILIVESTRKFNLDFFLMFNFSYALFFCVVPIIIILFPELLYFDIPANWAVHFQIYHDQLLKAVLYAFLFYCFFILIHKLLSNNSFISDTFRYQVQFVNHDLLFILGIGFLLFGIVSFFIYSTTMGGPVSAIVNAQLKRSGVYEAEGVFTFFKHFMKSVYFGLFIFLTVKPRNYFLRFLKSPLLILSIISTIIVLVVYSGRAVIIILLLSLLFYKNIINNRFVLKKRQIITYIVFLISFAVISAYFRPFMLMLSGREIILESEGTIMLMITSIIKAFSVPIISTMVAMKEISFHEISMGFGFFQVILDVIPKSIINPENIYLVNNLNTELFGFSSDGYNINSGLLAYFYYEFHWAGILIGSTVTAIIIKLCDDLFQKTKFNLTYGLIMTYFMLNVPQRILAGDQVSGVKSFLILLVEFSLLLLCAKAVKAPRIDKNRKKLSIIKGGKLT